MNAELVAALLPFFAACIAVELTPGPNMAYLALLGANRGRFAGFFAVAGVALGLLTIGLLAASGVSAVVESNRYVWEALRWAGVAYLLWLAYDTWLESQLPADDPDLDLPLLVFFRRGLVTNLLNPKAAIFYVTVMPNFTQAGTPLWPQMAILTLVYVSAATLVHSGIVVVAASLTAAFARDHWRRTLGIVFALLLVAVAGWLAVNTAR